MVFKISQEQLLLVTFRYIIPVHIYFWGNDIFSLKFDPKVSKGILLVFEFLKIDLKKYHE